VFEDVTLLKILSKIGFSPMSRPLINPRLTDALNGEVLLTGDEHFNRIFFPVAF
jgi:hypothetical protein